VVTHSGHLSQVLAALRAAVSQPRLDRYRPAGGTDLDMIVTYFWNVALSEALYPGLAALEVTLRSRIHAELSMREGTEWWFRRLLEAGQLRDYGSAHVKLYNRHKTALPAGHIVAEFNFGFWTTLLSQPYHQTLWAPNRAALLHAVFPHLPPTPNGRHVVHRRYNGLRLLRNRAMHYEPTWLGVTLDQRGVVSLADLRTEILEAIGWVSPRVRDGVAATDRFPSVWTGKTSFEADLRTRLGI